MWEPIVAPVHFYGNGLASSAASLFACSFRASDWQPFSKFIMTSVPAALSPNVTYGFRFHGALGLFLGCWAVGLSLSFYVCVETCA